MGSKSTLAGQEAPYGVVRLCNSKAGALIMRHYIFLSLCSIALTGAQILSLAAAETTVMAERVPTFQLRARVLMAGGQPADGRTFTFRFNVPSEVVQTVGTNWSDWLVFGLPQAEAALQRYPNTYLRRFPVVIN